MASARPSSPGLPRFMWPREHGAYPMVAMPLVTALALGVPTVASVAWSLAVAAGFLAHEPALVLLGIRGVRTKRDRGAAARTQLVTLGMLCVAGFAAGAVALPATITLTWLPSLVLGAVLAAFMVKGHEKSLAGESTAAALAAASLWPVALASGVSQPDAAWATAVWALALWLATLAVQVTLAHHKQKAARLAPVTIVAGALTLIGSWWASRVWGLAGMAAMPTAAIALVAAARPIRVRHLRRVGWSLVAANVATFALLLTLRAS